MSKTPLIDAMSEALAKLDEENKGKYFVKLPYNGIWVYWTGNGWGKQGILVSKQEAEQIANLYRAEIVEWPSAS